MVYCELALYKICWRGMRRLVRWEIFYPCSMGRRPSMCVFSLPIKHFMSQVCNLFLVPEAILTLELASFLESVCHLLLFMSVFFLAGDWAAAQSIAFTSSKASSPEPGQNQLPCSQSSSVSGPQALPRPAGDDAPSRRTETHWQNLCRPASQSAQVGKHTRLRLCSWLWPSFCFFMSPTSSSAAASFFFILSSISKNFTTY